MTASDADRRAAAERAWRALRPQVAEEARVLGEEADAFLARAELALFDVHGPLAVLYGDDDADDLFARALRIVLAAAAERPAALRRLDRRREIDPGWFQRSRMQGYVCYVDHFCGTLDRLPDHLDYLEELRGDDRPYLDGRAVGLVAVARGWQASVSTLATLRQVVHALRGWPTPLGLAINSGATTFDESGYTADDSVAGSITVLARQLVDFAENWSLQDRDRSGR